MRGFAAGGFIFRICEEKKMFIWEQNVHFVANLACFWKFEVLFKKMSKNIHLRAMMYIWKKKFHFVANLACFRKFEFFKKMSKNVKNVHLRAMMYIWEQNFHFVANLTCFWKFELKKNVKKCTSESNDVHLGAKCSFCGKFGIV